MRYQKLSPRQNLAMTWWNRPGFGDYDGIICDGSIRSGKTVAMTVGFIMWAMCRFQGQNFALCGKTIESLRRNVTTNLPTWLAGVFSFREYRTENKIVVSAAGRSNNFYLFGGRDESSASLIQGITLAGVLLDEVALMPRSFVEQACARCSVEGSKLWFNCNPEGPSHWFYLTWVLEAGKRNMLHLHFTMDDNLSLSAAVKARYESLYSGVFYDRFIRGLWVVAEGLIYTMFNKDFHVVPDVPRPYDRYYISVDYGTVNPTSMGSGAGPPGNGIVCGSITLTAAKRAASAPMRSTILSWSAWPVTCPSGPSSWTPQRPALLRPSGGMAAFMWKRPPTPSWTASGMWPPGSKAGTSSSAPAARTASGSLGSTAGTKRPPWTGPSRKMTTLWTMCAILSTRFLGRNFSAFEVCHV